MRNIFEDSGLYEVYIITYPAVVCDEFIFFSTTMFINIQPIKTSKKSDLLTPNKTLIRCPLKRLAIHPTLT